MYNRRTRGFSLIELMIALVIAGVLLAIAIPSYQGHVIKTRRNEARELLTSAGLAIEKFKAQNFAYNSSGGLNLSSFNNGYYQFSYPSGELAAQSFKILATPVSGSIVQGDGSWMMDNTGEIRWYPNNDTPNWNDSHTSY